MPSTNQPHLRAAPRGLATTKPTVAALADLITWITIVSGCLGMAAAAMLDLSGRGRAPFLFCLFIAALGLYMRVTSASERKIYGVLVAVIVGLTAAIPVMPDWTLLPMGYVLPLAVTSQYASRRRLAGTVVLAVSGFALTLWIRPPAHANWYVLNFVLFACVVTGTMTITRRLKQNLSDVFDDLQRLATRDVLTDTLNRRAFDELLAPWLSPSVARDTEATLVLLDIDHFKQVNDTHGHPAGDAVLMHVAQLIADCLRPTDVLARVGGEEFAILLPDTPSLGGAIAAEKVRRVVEVDSHECGVAVTISLGVASCATTGNPWIDADGALYDAKRGGRNQVAIAPPPLRRVG